MIPQIKKEEDGSLTVSLNLRLTGSMLEQEAQIAEAVNAVGLMATNAALRSFDSDGSSVIVDNQKYTSKGEKKKGIRLPTE